MTTNQQARCIAITGATGYLGGLLASYFVGQGDSVIALTRRRPNDESLGWRSFTLGSPVDPADLAGVDVLIHTAWSLGGSDDAEAWEENVVGSRMLVEAAEAAGVKQFVFVSSMSAYFGTKQCYGLMKLAVERTVLDKGYISVRPGLVYGDAPGGMAGTLKKIARLPLWPHFSGAKLFVLHDDEFAPALATLIDAYPDFAGQVVGFANPRPVGLAPLLAFLSGRDKPRPRIPVPAKSVVLAIKLVERMGVSLPFRSDSLLGLVRGPESVPGQELLAAHGVRFRPLAGEGTSR